MPVGSTVYTILRRCARSGMFRIIDLVIIRNGEITGVPLSLIEDAGFHYRYDSDQNGFRVSGAGMDMGFAVVYDLASEIYRAGYPCIGERCPANDHFNGDRDYTPGHTVHSDGGYALKHRWV